MGNHINNTNSNNNIPATFRCTFCPCSNDNAKWCKHEKSNSYEILMKTKWNGGTRKEKNNAAHKQKYKSIIWCCRRCPLFSVHVEMKCSSLSRYLLLSFCTLVTLPLSFALLYHSNGRNIVEWVWVKWMFDKEFPRVLKWMPGRHRKLCKNRNVNELKTFRDVYGNFITFKRYYCHCRHLHASNSNYFLFNVLKGVRMFGWICTFMFGTQNWISIFFLGSFRFGHNCPVAMVGPKRAMKL